MIRRRGMTRQTIALRQTLRRFVGSNSGETLVETLAAIVICTFASIILVSATLAAANLNKQADDLSAQLQQEQQKAELGMAGAESRDGTMKLTVVGYGVASYTIEFYGGDRLYGYRLKDKEAVG